MAWLLRRSRRRRIGALQEEGVMAARGDLERWREQSERAFVPVAEWRMQHPAAMLAEIEVMLDDT